MPYMQEAAGAAYHRSIRCPSEIRAGIEILIPQTRFRFPEAPSEHPVPISNRLPIHQRRATQVRLHLSDRHGSGSNGEAWMDRRRQLRGDDSSGHSLRLRQGTTWSDHLSDSLTYTVKYQPLKANELLLLKSVSSIAAVVVPTSPS